jgi:hypothetical protein
MRERLTRSLLLVRVVVQQACQAHRQACPERPLSSLKRSMVRLEQWIVSSAVMACDPTKRRAAALSDYHLPLCLQSTRFSYMGGGAWWRAVWRDRRGSLEGTLVWSLACFGDGWEGVVAVDVTMTMKRRRRRRTTTILLLMMIMMPWPRADDLHTLGEPQCLNELREIRELLNTFPNLPALHQQLAQGTAHVNNPLLCCFLTRSVSRYDVTNHGW